MKERIERLSKTTDETVIMIINKQLAEYEALKDIAKSTSKTADIKAMIDKKQALEKTIRLVEDTHAETQFESKNSVLKYLEDNGYKIASRTLDDHIKKGKVNRLSDGSFTKSDIDKYAKENLTRRESEDLQEQIKTVQLERARRLSEREQMKLATELGRLINRDKVGLEFAGRIEEMKKLFDEVAEKLPIELFGKDHAEMKEIIIAHHKHILETYSRKLEVLK